MIIAVFDESWKTVIVIYQHIILHSSRVFSFSVVRKSTPMLFFKNCYFNLILNDLTNTSSVTCL